MANVKQFPTAWAAQSKVNRFERDTVLALEDVVRDRLKAFYATTGRKPESIIVMRDGIADTQFRGYFNLLA